MAGSDVELEIESLAVGGDGVAHETGGRVVFVPGGVPGDRLAVRLVDERDRFARGRVRGVLRPSPLRVEPPCPEVARGCGGCSWQHLEPAAQRSTKRRLVQDALERIGRLPVGETLVSSGPDLPVAGFRTSLHCAVVDGRAGFHRYRSHEALRVGHCLVAHPLLDDLVADGRFPAAREVTMRCGARTGERLVIVSPSAAGIDVPSDVGVVVRDGRTRDGRTRDGRTGPRSAGTGTEWYHEEAAGRRWRISADSFFQTRADGADLLVERVRAALGTTDLRPGGGRSLRVLDACCGVGLLSAAAPDAELIAVEIGAAAVRDARVNLAGRAATVVGSALEAWPAEPVDAVIADPARRGLGAAGVATLVATGAVVIVLVSCDAGSLGRDAGLLSGSGYRLERCEVLDLFPHTAHVEVVSRFVLR